VQRKVLAEGENFARRYRYAFDDVVVVYAVLAVEVRVDSLGKHVQKNVQVPRVESYCLEEENYGQYDERRVLFQTLVSANVEGQHVEKNSRHSDHEGEYSESYENKFFGMAHSIIISTLYDHHSKL
jgi:hypothetical protein